LIYKKKNVIVTLKMDKIYEVCVEIYNILWHKSF